MKLNIFNQIGGTTVSTHGTQPFSLFNIHMTPTLQAHTLRPSEARFLQPSVLPPCFALPSSPTSGQPSAEGAPTSETGPSQGFIKL